MSEPLISLANRLFAHFWAKNERFAQKTVERSPSPVKYYLNNSKKGSLTNKIYCYLLLTHCSYLIYANFLVTKADYDSGVKPVNAGILIKCFNINPHFRCSGTKGYSLIKCFYIQKSLGKK